MAMANVYFLNAAPFPVEVLQLDEKGVENSHGLIQPGTRRMRPSYQGDAWRARAVREASLLPRWRAARGAVFGRVSKRLDRGQGH